MNDYVLTTTSTLDVTNDFLEKRNIKYVGFHFYINGKEYLDDLGKSLSYKDFYSEMKKGSDTKTSQVNVDEYLDFFREFLKKELDILHIDLSTGISSSNNSANVAKNILKEEFPNRKILIIDSLGASSGYGMLVDKAYELKTAGKTIDEVYDNIIKIRLNLHHWFYSTDLSYYVKGGRITQTAGFVGSLLRMNPLLNMDALGRLTPRYKVIGKKRVMAKILEKMIEHAEGGLEYSGKCFISHSDFLEDALLLAKRIESTFKNLNGKVEIFSVGTTIGSHTGPGTIALFFFGDTRE